MKQKLKPKKKMFQVEKKNLLTGRKVESGRKQHIQNSIFTF